MENELSVIIVSYNTKGLTLDCLKSIYSQKTNIKFNVWLVDNNSHDQTIDLVKKLFPKVNIIENVQNLGFSKGNNLALEKISSDYVLLLNSDTNIKDYTFDGLINFANKLDFAIVSCKLVNTDGSFQHNAGELPNLLNIIIWLSGIDDLFKKFKINLPSYHLTDERYFQDDKQVGWVSGTAMFIKYEVFKTVGYLDENIFMYTEDVEFCLRAKGAGFKTGWTRNVQITHIGGASSKDPKLAQWRGEFNGLLYLYKKYYGNLAAVILRFIMYLFIILRIVGFGIFGKYTYAKTYLQIITSI